MTCLETYYQKGKRISDIQKDVERIMSSLYKSRMNDGEVYFTNRNGVEFHIVTMGEEEPWNALVIEYMDTMEDGDLWYPEDYPSIDSLIEAMKAEIEES